jgi:hypothetical protein
MPRISTASEEEDWDPCPGSWGGGPGIQPGISSTSEEEDPGSMPGICNGATTEEEGGGPGFHTRDLHPVPRGTEVSGEEKEICLIDILVIFTRCDKVASGLRMPSIYHNQCSTFFFVPFSQFCRVFDF